jgi:hypothetical protein
MCIFVDKNYRKQLVFIQINTYQDIINTCHTFFEPYDEEQHCWKSFYNSVKCRYGCYSNNMVIGLLNVHELQLSITSVSNHLFGRL